MGSHLATMLSGNGHDITVIDRDAKALEEVGTLADIITVEGDSTTFEALRKASTRKCDLFIAVNHTENDNIVAAVIAKQLGARKTIARIDNNEYLEPNNKEIFIEMGIDYLFYPEKVAAAEVVDLLGHTSTTEYVDFSGGRLSLSVFKLEPTSPLVGRELAGFSDSDAELSYRTVAITRDGRTIIPHAEERFEEGDTIYVIARQDAVREVNDLSTNNVLGSYKESLDANVFTFGLGTEYLAKFGALNVTPHAGIRLSRIDMDDSKYGADYDAMTVYQLPLGVAFSGNFDVNGWKLAPMVDLSVVPAFGDKDAVATYTGGIQSVTRVVDTNPIQATLGVSAQNGAWTFGLNYGLTAGGDDRMNNAFNANLRYSF